MGLPEIEKMIQQGDFNHALEAVEELGTEERLDGLILKGRILHRKGELNDALKAAEEALRESRTNGTELQILHALISCGYIYENLNFWEQLSEAIQEGEKLLSNLEQEDKIAIKHIRHIKGSLYLLKGDLYWASGQSTEVLEHFEKSLAIREELGNSQEIAETLTEIGCCHLNATNKLDSALDYLQRGVALREALGNKTDIANSLNTLGICYTQMGNSEEGLRYYQESLALYEALENRRQMATLYHNLTFAMIGKEEYALARDYAQKHLVVRKELDQKDGLAAAYNVLGWLHLWNGELDHALNYFKNALTTHEEFLGQTGLNFRLNCVGFAYLAMGELETALSHYERALDLCKAEPEPDVVHAWILTSMAKAFSLKGEAKVALDTINQALKVLEVVDHQLSLVGALTQKGIIYRMLGESELALKVLEEGLNQYPSLIAPELQKWYFLSETLLHLILVAQDLKAREKAAEYLKQMQEIQQKTENKYIRLRKRFAEALVLKMSKRGTKKLQAQQAFQEIVEEEIIEYDITVLAILNLCELLILEVKISEAKEELLAEIVTLSTKLYEMAQDQKAPMVIIMALILQAKIAMVEGGLKKATGLLDNAIIMADEKKLGNLLMKARFEQETLAADLEKWEELSRRNASIKERFQQARFDDYHLEALKLQGTKVSPSVDMIGG
ncbi:MAG: tetratricopeptide repeat protein [Candidatus Hodarchaeota archaeon]